MRKAHVSPMAPQQGRGWQRLGRVIDCQGQEDSDQRVSLSRARSAWCLHRWRIRLMNYNLRELSDKNLVFLRLFSFLALLRDQRKSPVSELHSRSSQKNSKRPSLSRQRISKEAPENRKVWRWGVSFFSCFLSHP